LVCEEAHRYVPLNASMGFEPCKRAIAKIAKEGRKYGASLCIVTQRPSEIDPTILSQCNTVFALRMSNDRDQEIVTSAISDTGQGLLEFLPALGQREAIAFGDGVTLPVRIKFDELAKNCMPRSSTARFSEKWQRSVGDEGFLEGIVERWRASSSGANDIMSQSLALLADAMGSVNGEVAQPIEPDMGDEYDEAATPAPAPMPVAAGPTSSRLPRRTEPSEFGAARQAAAAPAAPAAQPRAAGSLLRRDLALPTTAAAPGSANLRQQQAAAAPQPAAAAASGGGGALRSLREKLLARK
jgi:hypothetical protein